MKRLLFFVLPPSVLLVAVACGELFEDPQQCAFDRDCTRFGPSVTCDITRKVCVEDSVATRDGGVDGSSVPTPDAGDGFDASTPPSCDISPKPVADVPGATTDTAQGPQKDVTTSLTLDCSKDWRLAGRLVVKAGATLTIQPGTKILADKQTNAGIVVQPGARIVARGTSDKPIVITSAVSPATSGDWRGVFVLGNAPPGGGVLVNGDPVLNYGGNVADDESGALEFVRIEYSASGLTLAGVGSKTLVDNVEILRPNDNCFVINGGRVNTKHLVCEAPVDEMFELGNGYQGKMQFLFGFKTGPGGGHNGFLTDNAYPTVYNATMCGDNVAREGYGLVFRNGSRLEMNNAIFSGWATGIDAVGGLGTPIEIRNSIVADNATNPAFAEDAGIADQNSPLFDDDNGFDEIAHLADGNRANRASSAGLVNCYDVAAPQPYPATALGGARTPPNDGFFDPTATYVGAVKDPNDAWIRGRWLRFE